MTWDRVVSVKLHTYLKHFNFFWVVSFLTFFGIFLFKASLAQASIGDGVFVYDQTTPSTNVQQNLWLKSSVEVGAKTSPFAGTGTSKHIQIKGSTTRKELLLGIQDSAGTLTIYKSTDEGASWTSQWSATVGDGNLKRFDISYEQTSGDALVVYSANVGTTNEILYQTWDGSNWSGAQNHDNIRTSGTVYGIKGAERNDSNEIGIVWVDTNLNMSADLWTGSAWYGEPSASLCSSALCTIARTGGASPSVVPTHRGYDLAFESQSGDLMVVWGNDSLSVTQTDPRYLFKTAGGAWGAAAGTAIANLTEDGEMLDISPSPASDRIALTTCSLDTGSDCNFIVWSGTAWGTVASDTTSGTMITGESSNNTEWLVDGANEVAIMTYGDAAATGIDWYTSTNGGTPAAKTDETAAPIMGAVAERAGFSKAFPTNPARAMFIFEDNNSDIWVKIAKLSGTTVTWSTPNGISAALETNASVAGFNPVGFGFSRYGLGVSTTDPVGTSITSNSATLNGVIDDLIGGAPNERGFDYSTDALMTEKFTTVESGIFGTGAFTANVTGLPCNATIYARAYATNSVETGYGATESFTTSGPCTFIPSDEIGDGVFMYDQTTPSTDVQTLSFDGPFAAIGGSNSPFVGSGDSKHVQMKGGTTRQEYLAGIQDSVGTLTIYKSTDGQTWTSQWSATVGDGNLKRFDISYEQTSGDALVVYSANVGTTNEILYQTWDGSNWSGALNHDNIRTSGTVYGIKGAERNSSNEIGIVWVDTSNNMSADLWTGSSWYGEPSASLCSAALCTIARTGGATPSSVPTHRGYDLAFESLSGDLMVVWGNDSGTTTQTDPRYLMKTAGGAWGAAAGTAIANLTEDGEMLDISPSPASDRIALTTCSLDSGSDCNFIVWSGSAWGTVASDTASGTMITGESSNNTEWLVDGANEVAIMTYGDAAAAGIDWYTSTNGGTPVVQADNNVAPIMGAIAERAGFSKAFPNDPSKALFIFEDANADIWVKVARLRGTLVSWYTPAGISAAIETNASVVGFNPVGFGFLKYVTPPVSGITISGTVYHSDGMTPDGTGYTLNISKNGEVGTTTTSNGSGVFSFDDLDDMVDGDVITIWTAGGGATSIFSYGASCISTPNCTGISLVRGEVILKTFDGNPISNADIAMCDVDVGAGCSTSDIGVDSDGVDLTVDDNYSLIVDSTTTFAPGGSLTVNHLDILGTVSGTTETIYLKGDFNNSGSFSIGSGTINLIDNSKTANIYGSNTFNNFTVSSAGKNVNFESSTTTTINGQFNISGASGSPVILNSTTGSSAWTINIQGSSSVSHVSVSWSSCDVSSNTVLLDSTSNSGGHNGNCWRFIIRSGGGGSSGDGPGSGSAGQGGGDESGGASVQATATAILVIDVITSINMVNNGSGYLLVPLVCLVDGSGTGAILTANILGGSVVSVSVVNGGSGYGNPTVVIGAPGTSGGSCASGGGGGGAGGGGGGSP